jgi:type IV pilus assembly protein PilA
MKTMQKGFTLIELMIVVAIIAILAAIAIPAYQNYLIRTQVTEGVTLMDGAKVAATEYFANKGEFPTGNGIAGLAPPTSIVGKYVSSVTLAQVTAGANGSGTITSVFSGSANSAISTKNVVLTGTRPATSENITWTCTGSVDAKFLPSSCR